MPFLQHIKSCWLTQRSSIVWGPRPRGVPTPGLYADVLLSDIAAHHPDYPGKALDALKLSYGLRVGYLARVCKLWHVAVMRRVEAWKELRVARSIGEKGPGLGQFTNPLDVAALPDGQVCVADFGMDRLQIFSRHVGAAPRTVSEPLPYGWEAPSAVTCDGGMLYVTVNSPGHDYSTLRKLRLADGVEVARSPFIFSRPEGLCVVGDVIFVCDTGHHGVLARSTTDVGDGIFGPRYPVGWGWKMSTVTGRYAHGSGDGEFWHPSAVAFTGAELYVADQSNHRVQARLLATAKYLHHHLSHTLIYTGICSGFAPNRGKWQIPAIDGRRHGS